MTTKRTQELNPDELKKLATFGLLLRLSIAKGNNLDAFVEMAPTKNYNALDSMALVDMGEKVLTKAIRAGQHKCVELMLSLGVKARPEGLRTAEQKGFARVAQTIRTYLEHEELTKLVEATTKKKASKKARL